MRRTHPVVYALMMGAAGAISSALIVSCVLAVAGLPWPSRTLLYRATAVLAVATGIVVGFRSWHKQKQRPTISYGRCPDCGRELQPGQTACSLCGRNLDVK